MRQPWPVSYKALVLGYVCISGYTHLYQDLQLKYRPQREEYPDSRSKDGHKLYRWIARLFQRGLHDLKFYPLKFLMHFKDGATSYLRPVLMDGFYPHFAGYLGLQMWWLGSHQLSPRKVAASVRDRTGDLSHDRPRSYQDATGASLKCCSIVISKKLGKLIGWEEQQRRYWVPKRLIDSVIWWFNFKLLRQWTN